MPETFKKLGILEDKSGRLLPWCKAAGTWPSAQGQEDEGSGERTFTQANVEPTAVLWPIAAKPEPRSHITEHL